MKRLVVASAGLLGAVAVADDLRGVDRLLCATAEVIACVEQDDCYTIPASDLDVPEFVVVDVKGKTLSTTKASKQSRSTPIASLMRTDGSIFLQGIEGGRAFSFVIDEETGHVTVAVSRDGLTVTVFGVCTDADI
jgi:hypothetical protein